MKLNALEQKIDGIIRPVIEELGFYLSWIEYKGGILQIFAENPKNGNLNLAECSTISREISPILEVEDPIESAYRLEVSSPGVDRLLVRESDYERYCGFTAKIELDTPLDGQKRFRGTIEEKKDGQIALKTDTGLVNLPFRDISKAKLVMTDDLMKTSKKWASANDNPEGSSESSDSEDDKETETE
jgi:ribosome maturation factor RimP